MARVLITDDEEMDRLLLHSLLGDAGHELFFAKEGESAVDAYVEHDIDVVVTDLVMPHWNGLELIVELRNLDHAAAIVVVSGAAEDELEEARTAGAMFILPKPVDPRELVEAVDRACREHDLRSDPWS